MREKLGHVQGRLRAYWSMTKSLQSGLLLVTGLAGYMSARCPVITWPTLLGLSASLFMSISGSTVLNMVYDRDIDAIMQRTCSRPLPTKIVTPGEGLALGILLVAAGLGWAWLLSPLYAAIVAAGVFFDVVVYTLWLKRRTAWSILWGGLAGGMPVMAGRALGLGHLDWIGATLALAVLLWIPTHIMTFSMRYREDYARAGVPTFPASYGDAATRLAIALSSVMASLAMAAAAYGIGMAWGYLRLLAVLSAGLLLLSVASMRRPSLRLNLGLFKYASLYMLGSMLLVIVGTL